MSKKIQSPIIIASIFISMVLIILALSFILKNLDFGPPTNKSKYGPGLKSPSAIGYAGLFDLLKKEGYPVREAQKQDFGLDEKISATSGSIEEKITFNPKDTLILLEPDQKSASQLEPILKKVPRILLILPKWTGVQDRTNRTNSLWIRDLELISTYPLKEIVRIVTGSQNLINRFPLKIEHWSSNKLGIEPQSFPFQIIIGDEQTKDQKNDFIPLIESSKPNICLLARWDYDPGSENIKRSIWVLSDPDIINNFGLTQKDNALLALRLIDNLYSQDEDFGNLLFIDNTGIINLNLPNQKTEPLRPKHTPKHTWSIWDLLTDFPFFIITILTLLTGLLAAWAGTGRFGPPINPTSPLDFGKLRLIENSARLLELAGHLEKTLERYENMTYRLLATTLHGPKGASLAELKIWLEVKSKNLGLNCISDSSFFDSPEKSAKGINKLMARARSIHSWKGKMLNGSKLRRSHN